MENITVTILVDNKTNCECQAEHGFAMWIEALGKKILFDSGNTSKILFENASKLGIDLLDTDIAIISHGHYDHTGALADVLKKTGCLVYFHPEIFRERYSLKDGKVRFVGVGKELCDLLNSLPGKQKKLVTSPIKIGLSIGLTGPIPRIQTFEDTGGNFFLDNDCSFVDTIEDDLAMWFETDKGLVIFLGCSHSGIINTLEYITELTETSKIDTVIGGMHLVNANLTRLNSTIDALNEYDIDRIIPCHCTGDKAMELLSEKLNCEVIAGQAGYQIVI